MKKIKVWFMKQKLNVKFTLMSGVIIFIPILVILLINFRNIKRDTAEQQISNLKYTMSKNYGVVQKTVDLCNMSTQVLLNYKDLNEFLKCLQQQQKLSTMETIDFYKEDIGMLERIVNANPYLYQLRVYAKSNDFSEMMPILFKEERMETFPWADEYKSGSWEFKYKDEIFSTSVNYTDYIMGLITTIEDYEYGEIGVIEASVKMEDVFENIFEGTDSEWTCFVDESGEIYSKAAEAGSIWENHKREIINVISKESSHEKYYQTKLLNKSVVVGILPMKELSGYMVRIINMSEKNLEIHNLQSIYIIGVLLLFICLVVVVNIIVNVLLKNFYSILDIITSIQEGDLEARVNKNGYDEMGQLGMQIDKMLDTIERLMQENINRELLMKNSEIKALQNQINAHFIYNVLESIKMMAEIDEKYEISDAITWLGKLLRYGMKWSSRNVTVAQEIEYVRNYINLINLRFDYNIILSLNIPKYLNEQELPKISLQPIVENAIYHGIEELEEDATIYIKAYEEHGDCFIEITDSGKGMNEEAVENLKKKIAGEIEVKGGSGNGIGLKNVQDRIRISFGDAYGISVASKEGCYTKVIVKLPITYKGEVNNE